jgi:DNA replication licensing factor MCM2
MVKEKARLYQYTRYAQPDLVTVKVTDLEERVSQVGHVDDVLIPERDLEQARTRDIYDMAPFLHSKLFEKNGYQLNGEVIEKRFNND